MQRGELDGQMVGLSSVRTGQRDLWNRHAFRPLLAFGRTTRHPEFPDIPIGRELAGDPEALSLIEFAELPFFMALPFAAPPDVPADRANALQTAFMAMCADQAFLEEAEKLGIEMSPIEAGAILQLLARTAKTPPEVIARYTARAGEKVTAQVGRRRFELAIDFSGRRRWFSIQESDDSRIAKRAVQGRPDCADCGAAG
jgi:hypothetical protein